MEKTYRVALEVDLSAMERVDATPDDNVMRFYVEVKADNAPEAAFRAVGKFADDLEVISIVPVREG